MTIEDFWLRLYDISSDLQPVSTVAWNDRLETLVADFKKFPAATQEALRGHVAVMIDRLKQLHARLIA